MKKIYLFVGGLLIMTLPVVAQRVNNATPMNFIKKELSVIKKESTNRADGDTLLLFDGSDFYVTNPQDILDFELENFDGDGLTAANPGWDPAFVYAFYSLDTADFIPNYDTDTAFYIGATSWFTPFGQADNWWSFGPITIPAGGADLSWYHRVQQHNYADGYKVFISTQGVVPYTDVDPTVDTPIFSKADCSNCPADTFMVRNEVSLNSYASQRVWIHYRHDADDQNALYLDHMLVTENDNVSVAEKMKTELKLSQNQPNPASQNTIINYETASNGNVLLRVFNVAGKEVMAINEGMRTAGRYRINLSTADLSSGVYYYTLTAGDHSMTKKMVIVE